MNWKTILHLVRVDMKSGRLTRGQKLIKYNVTRNRFFSYLGYLAAIIIGVVVGGLVSYFYTSGLLMLLFKVILMQRLLIFSFPCRL